MNDLKHAAKRLTKPGQIPAYEYRGHHIERYGKGWAYFTDQVNGASTLENAKWFIDAFIERGMK
jgi:hypothetical protein